MSVVATLPEFQKANGRSGIENAEAAPLYDVLIITSEKKLYEEAMDAFYERKSKT